ncbi:GNAT family N-acetyltransferase [Nocardioides ultimimeridianus]
MNGADGFDVRVIGADELPILRWLWQAFRADLASVVHGLPYADGRYQAKDVDDLPRPDVVGYLAWRPHPNTGEDAPIAFALVDGIGLAERSVSGFWVAPAARRDGVGIRLALDVLARHPGPWAIAFQHENPYAASFWRRVADRAFGASGWTEERVPVPGRPHVPADHWIHGQYRDGNASAH